MAQANDNASGDGAPRPIPSAAHVRLPDAELTRPIQPGPRLSLYADRSGEQALHRVIAQSFYAAPPGIPNYGFTGTVYFGRLLLRNEGPPREVFLQVEYPLLDLIDLYYCNQTVGAARPWVGPELPVGSCPRETWTHHRAGDRLPFDTRIVRQRTFLFPLRLHTGDSVVYLRFESSGTQEFPIRLIGAEALRRADTTESLALGLYYGILLVLSLYNLVLYFIVRDRSYLFYLFYITGYGLIQLNLNGLAFQYFWPDSPVWANISLPAFIGWAFVWATQFSRTFLGSSVFAPALDRALRMLMAAFAVLLAGAFVLPYSWNIYVSAVLVIGFSLLVVVAALRVHQRGFRPARYFLLAWFSLLLGVTLFALKGLGYLPANFVTEYGLQIGSALEMGLLSLGLADRISVMQEEQEQTARRALELEQIRKAAELQAARLEIELLKKNVEPHFLLNSINAVMVWLAEDPKNAGRLLQALADELRILLSVSSRTTIRVDEEVQLCRTHLDLMSLRHDKRFELVTEGLVDDEQIPPLVFHTVIENGLSHGFHERDRGSFLLRRLVLKDGVRFVLSNDGSRSAERQGTGMGLRYVRTRLAEAYPEGWELDSHPTETGWQTSITIQSKAVSAKSSDS